MPEIQLESRVGRLEGAMESLTHDVQEVTRSVKHLAENMGGFRETILANIGTATAPRWPIIISIGVLIMMIVGLGGAIIPIVMSGQRESIEYNQATIEKLKEAQHIRLYQNGYDEACREHLNERLIKLEQ